MNQNLWESAETILYVILGNNCLDQSFKVSEKHSWRDLKKKFLGVAVLNLLESTRSISDMILARKKYNLEYIFGIFENQ